MWCVHGLLLSYRFCSCATVLVVVMVLVCGCSCSVSKARVPVPLTALPVVFFALAMEQAAALSSCSNALSRAPMAWYRSSGNKAPVHSATERQFSPPSLCIDRFFPWMSVWMDTPSHSLTQRFTGAYRCRIARADRAIRSASTVLSTLAKARILIAPLVSLALLHSFFVIVLNSDTKIC